MVADLNRIRAWNGSQHHAFEELCVQLACYDPVPEGSLYIRKGTPDAGVECYWTLPSGDEWAWQAKYFFEFGQSQAQQIVESFCTAIERHPRLRRYVVCLPINLADPRTGSSSARSRWEEMVNRCQRRAAESNRDIEILLWGETEILQRLTLAGREGLIFLFFNERVLSDAWLQSFNTRQIRDADPKYTADLNVEVPIAENFWAFARDPLFYRRLAKLRSDILEQIEKLENVSIPEAFRPENATLIATVRNCASLIHRQGDDYRLLAWDDVRELSGECMESARHLLRKINAARESTASDSSGNPSYRSPAYHENVLNTLWNRLRDLQGFSGSDEADLSNAHCLLLTGSAGQGKTHLLCDIASRRSMTGRPTLLFHGFKFNNRDVWAQMREQLDLPSATSDELLGALNVVGQSRRCRALILIDALNESDERQVWRRYLGGMIETIKPFPWVGIVISVRSSYLDDTLPVDFEGPGVVRIEHDGFRQVANAATGAFFAHYGILAPAVPLLAPEFCNPLFLKILCVGLSNRGLNHLPLGSLGLAAVFDGFVASIEEKISKEDRLDYNVEEGRVASAIRQLCDAMQSVNHRRWLSRTDAQAICGRIHPAARHSTSLLKALLDEGVLQAERFPAEAGGSQSIIMFAYDRMSDYFHARQLLEASTALHPDNLFSTEGPLSFTIESRMNAVRHRGLLEMLSILIPEECGVELISLVPRLRMQPLLCEALLDSLVWRTSNSVSTLTLKAMRSLCRPGTEYYPRLIEILFCSATRSEHPLNSRYMHNMLLPLRMPERDSTWTAVVQEHFQDTYQGTPSALDRFIEWADSPVPHSRLSSDERVLASLALGWCLSSSNRPLRDRATKGMIAILYHDIGALLSVLRRFKTCDDPYIIERLYAVAYGCAIRSTKKAELAALAKYTIRSFFKSQPINSHQLTRDYARNIVEYAQIRGCRLRIKQLQIRPPFPTPWHPPLGSDEFSRTFADHQTNGSGYSTLWDSIMGFSDFARYIIGTNSNMSPWASLPLTSTLPIDNDCRLPSLDTSLAQRWIYQRVLDLGWTPELFSSVDRGVSADWSRYKNRVERLSKKYQWIAYHELMGHFADHYHRVDVHQEGTYEGPWQDYDRDLDISLLSEAWLAKARLPNAAAWWIPTLPLNLLEEAPNATWLRKTDNLPTADRLIHVRDPRSSGSWMILDGILHWREPILEGEVKPTFGGRECWIKLHAFIFNRSQLPYLLAKLKSVDLESIRIPDAPSPQQVFLGEFPWATAYRNALPPEDRHSYDAMNLHSLLEVPLRQFANHYHWEAERDNSLQQLVNVRVPDASLIDGMQLRDSHKNGQFSNGGGQIVTCDPSVGESGPSVLLGHRDLLLRYTASHDLGLLWLFQGEKTVTNLNGPGAGRLNFNGWIVYDGAEWSIGPTRSHWHDYA